MKTILVVDDQEDLRKSLGAVVESAGYSALFAEDGKAAQQVLALEHVDLVVSDIRMPHASGIELLHYIKRTGGQPVILMTGFSEILERGGAIEIGADGFLPKPFLKADLLAAIQACLGDPDQVPEPAELNTQYCALSIDDFISKQELQCDVYIRLGSGKFVKIAHRGELIDMERIRSYKAKQVQSLFMKKEDFSSYVGFNLTLVQAAIQTHQISVEKKVALLRNTGAIMVENLFFNGVDRDSLEYSKVFVESSIKLISHDPQAFGLLNILNDHSDLVYINSVGVAFYSLMMAKKLGWTGGSNLFKIVMGGLLHDIGKKEIDAAVLRKPRAQMTPAEAQLVDSHPLRGMELLGRIPSIPSDVVQIVAQHHEDCVGTGFPKGLTRNAIHPLARLIAVADGFCCLALKSAEGPGIAPHAAIVRMLELYSDRLDPTFFTALMGIFNFDPPPQYSDPQKWAHAQKGKRG